jgi:hypothetical protein
MQQTSSTRGEVNFIKQEIDALGELLKSERLDRKTEIDLLQIDIQTLKKTLEALIPGFNQVYKNTYSEIVLNFDPEAQRDAVNYKKRAG